MMNATLKKTFIEWVSIKDVFSGVYRQRWNFQEVFNVDCSSKEVRKMYGQPVSALSSRSKRVRVHRYPEPNWKS